MAYHLAALADIVEVPAGILEERLFKALPVIWAEVEEALELPGVMHRIRMAEMAEMVSSSTSLVSKRITVAEEGVVVVAVLVPGLWVLEDQAGGGNGRSGGSLGSDGATNTGGGGGGSGCTYSGSNGGSGIVIVRYKSATCSDQSCGTNYYHDGSDCVACPTGSTRMPETANQCLCPENHHRSVDGGVHSCAACAQGSTRLPGDTVPGGDATTCTSSVSPPPPPPSAQALEKVAEETRDSILDDIADERLKAKVKLLADAAIAGAKVQRLTAKMSAADEDTACSNAFSGAGMSSGDGACVATAASSGKRRRLSSTTYDVELMFSSATVSDDALTTAADALKTADGVTSVASQASVDPITELKTVPGVDTSKLQTFDTQAQAAVAAAASTPPPSIPPPTPPPPPPPPSAQALEKVAEETRDSILDDIADGD